jgi:signal transduction histidine kinase
MGDSPANERFRRLNSAHPLPAGYVASSEVDEMGLEERSRLATIIDNVPVGLVFADVTGRITGGNKQAERIFRHPVLLSPTPEDYGEWIAYHPDGRRVQPLEYPLARTLSDEQVHTGEFLHQCGDGVRRWVIFHSAPICSSEGKMIGAVVVTLDIDERKRTQDALLLKNMEVERQNAELSTIYDTAPIGLALFSVPDYRYLRLNERQAAFFGLRPEQIVGKTLTEMAPIEGLKELFDQVASGDPIINYPLEGALVTDPQNYRYWTVSYFPVHASDGSIQAITAASLEITQQKKAELALIQSEKLAVVGRLASSISHEINNPLEAVTNLLFLASQSTELAEAQQFIHTAEIELRRVAAIASQTLRFHKQASSPQAITAEQLLDSVLSIFQGRLINSGVHIASRDRAPTPVRCFEGEIRQVLSNLVGNSLDAMGQSGTLFLRSRQGSQWSTGEQGITITVADTGSGMSTETLQHLFSPFFTTKGLTGTGLGLWISKEIIDRHLGHLRVRSNQSPQRHGTVFTLFLPFDAAIR